MAQSRDEIMLIGLTRSRRDATYVCIHCGINGVPLWHDVTWHWLGSIGVTGWDGDDGLMDEMIPMGLHSRRRRRCCCFMRSLAPIAYIHSESTYDLLYTAIVSRADSTINPASGKLSKS